MSKWKLRVEGRAPVGPLETDLIVRGIRAGRVPFDAEVCAVGSEAWVALASIEEFYEAMGLDDALTRVVDAPSAGGHSPPEVGEDDGVTQVMPATPAMTPTDSPAPQPPAPELRPGPGLRPPHAPQRQPTAPRFPVVPAGPGAHGPHALAAPRRARSAVGSSVRIGQAADPLVDAGDDDPTVVPGAPFEIVSAAPPLDTPSRLQAGHQVPWQHRAEAAPGSRRSEELMDAIDDSDDVRVVVPAAGGMQRSPAAGGNPKASPPHFRPDEPDESTAPALRVVRERRQARLAWIAVAALAAFVLVLLALLVAQL